MNCPHCYGTGVTGEIPCPECGGYGQIHCCEGLREAPECECKAEAAEKRAVSYSHWGMFKS